MKVTVVTSGSGNLPDLTIISQDIQLADYTLGQTATLKALVRNTDLLPASNVKVQFYELGTLLGETTLDEVSAQGLSTATLSASIATAGEHLIQVVVDSANLIPELDEANNQASKIIEIGASTQTAGSILVSGSLPTTVYSNSLFTLSGRAVYDLVVNGVRNTDYVVKGGSVQITVKGDGGAEWVYGDVHTNINGNLAKSLQAPATPGTYHLVMTVTDKTFIGKRELVFKVIERPPVESPPPAPPTTSGIGNWTFMSGTWTWTWTTHPKGPTPQSDLRVFSENIYFSKNHPAVNEEITVFAEIRYWATSTDILDEDVPINIYVIYPGTPRIKIGSTTIDKMSVGSPDFGSRYVYATWKNRADGIYLVEVEIDPSFVEENMQNNAATRAIIVGQMQSHKGAISGQVTDSWGSGIGNVILQVTEADGTPLGSTATDPAGFYLVENLPVGETRVYIETPPGYQAEAETKTTTVADTSVSAVNFLLAQQVAPPADTTPPVLSLPSPITAEATSPSGALVTYTASAMDGVDGTVIPSCAPASGSTYTLGVTNVNCSASDKAGNTASGSFSVTVRDTIPPTLVCPADIGVMQGQQLNLGTPVVSDIVDTSPTLSNNAAANFPVGITAVIWTASDDAGNQSICTQQVRITVPLLCDIDLDGDVDRNDTSLITAARNQAAVPGDLRDLDGDGRITVNDARSCVLKCTRSSCATQ